MTRISAFNIRDIWRSPAAGRLPVLVHWAASLLFAVFCGRLLFATMILQGLPGQPLFWLFWIVTGFFAALGCVFPRNGLVLYLCGFPMICAAHELKAVPIGNLPVVCFAAFFVGWLLRSLLVASQQPRDLLGFGVNCLALALLLSSIFSLLHPSWSNSFSVAFSIPSWPEKTEFSAMTMGLNATAGCMLFGMLRSKLSGSKQLLIMIVSVQLAGICLFALPEFACNLLLHRDAGRNLISLPFGAVHNMGGPACLFAGFFAALAAVRLSVAKRAWGPLLGSGLAILVIAGSVSKGAWLAVALTMILLLFQTTGWKSAIGALLLLLVLAGGLRAGLAGRQKQGTAAEHLHALVSADEWAKNETLSERMKIWGKAVAIMEASPLSGVGLGSFSSIMEHYGSRDFPGSKIWSEYAHAERSLAVPDDQVTYNGFHCHNDILELAAGAGMPVALLFILLVGTLVALGLRVVPASDPNPALAGAFAIVCFLLVSLIDSRLLSFPDNLLFWQFAAFIPMSVFPVSPGETSSRAKKWSFLPALAPLSVIVGGSALLLSGSLPSNRTFGVWNWGLPSGDGGFLLAREAQFVVPPDEDLKALVFSVPGGNGPKEIALHVRIDGREAASARIGSGRELCVDMESFRHSGQWVLVKTEADRWAGRGAFGTPFGVKPYAIAMHKIRE